MPQLPAEDLLRIVRLAHGYRVDLIAHHPASGESRQFAPSHYATLDLARQYAAMVSRATGARIEEHLA